MSKKLLYLIMLGLFLVSCDKDSEKIPEKPDVPLTYQSVSIDGISDNLNYENIGRQPKIEIVFSAKVDEKTVPQSLLLTDKDENKIATNILLSRDDSVLIIQPNSLLNWISKYKLTISSDLKSQAGYSLITPVVIDMVTAMDSTDKFPLITDDELLSLVQKQTFRYFWDFAHPVSGMARERSTSGDIVTTGGTGFGIMSMIVAVERGFISRRQAIERLLKITDFLAHKCTTYHGAFSHWINGASGDTQPFSEKDNGGDLVETSFLFQGLLTARQYFSGTDAAESRIREDINSLWEAVEWNWYCRGGQKVLYWHWSPDYEWAMNHQIRGWNECLITYILAASSPSFPITKEVYDEGWASNGSMKNGGSYYGIKLPLGEAYGGPLFFSHYSFLGLNPVGLKDGYADYWEQNVNHTKINYAHCVQNPFKYLGYSLDCWGLTASDGDKGYSAHSPTNDKGVITPAAALSSMPYTPEESMAALRFFYYKLGNKLWKEYGFVDAFNLTENWYDPQFLAIDQGPIIIMIENYRTGLLWNLFMTCPEVQKGLTTLEFNYQIKK